MLKANVGKRKESFSFIKLKDSHVRVNDTVKRENCQELEELAYKNKINLRVEGTEALLHDYEVFKNNPVIHSLIVKEILRRTEKIMFIKIRGDWHSEIYLGFSKTGWTVEPRFIGAPALADLQRIEHFSYDDKGIKEMEKYIGGDWDNPQYKTIAKLYLIAGRIRFLIEKLKRIREQVKTQPESRSSLWHSYKAAQDELASLDPSSEETKIGILGKRYFVGLADQE